MIASGSPHLIYGDYISANATTMTQSFKMQTAQDALSLQGGPRSRVCVFKHLLFTGDAFISITRLHVK